MGLLQYTVELLEFAVRQRRDEMPIDKTIERLKETIESAAPITGPQRRNLPSSKFAVPGKRKLPLDSCSRVKNSMARFNQTQGLTSEERRTAFNKIVRAARKCGIDPSGFVKKFGKR
jgi:hypothetical protein